MIISLVIPFGFMLFMSVSMNRVWGLYNFLQVISNLRNYRRLMIPAASDFLLVMVESVSNFSFLKEQNVQVWLKEYVFGKSKKLQQILTGDGVMMLTLIVSLPLIGALLFLLHKFKNSSHLQKLKAKLMWSSVLRSQL